MRTGDVILIHNSTVAVLRETLKEFKLGIHDIPSCTATGGKPAAILRGIPDDEYYSDVQDRLMRRDITAQFFPLKEVVVLTHSKEDSDLIAKLRAKELED